MLDSQEELWYTYIVRNPKERTVGFHRPYHTVVMNRKTKIICTLGPASDTEETLRAMIEAGMDVARLNFSHGTYEDHAKKAALVRKLRKETGHHIALLLDTKGPEVRLG